MYGKILKDATGKKEGTAGRILILKEHLQNQQYTQLKTDQLTNDQVENYQSSTYGLAPTSRTAVHAAQQILLFIKILQK
eukprot:snap_masked-scaffold_49-processed-gene-1.24-mRNA-1 protein AED:1.00 eAED:1.00 QI:0/-1/0/0/-1/1/1/0/78